MSVWDEPDLVRDIDEAARWTDDGLAPEPCERCGGDKAVPVGYGRTKRTEACPRCVTGVEP